MSLSTHDPARGLRIRAARERRGWNQQELADAVGAAVRTVRSWERGGSVRLHATVIEDTLGISLHGPGSQQPRLDEADDTQLAAELIGRLAELRGQVRDLEHQLAGNAESASDD